MTERDELLEELKHLVRYYFQATHEFFDEASNETEKRVEAIYKCLKKNKNSIDDYREMIAQLVSSQADLKKRVESLSVLTERMSKLLGSE